MTSIRAGGCGWLLSVSDRECLPFTAPSGTQRARGSFLLAYEASPCFLSDPVGLACSAGLDVISLKTGLSAGLSVVTRRYAWRHLSPSAPCIRRASSG
jgi:hypothetical protein